MNFPDWIEATGWTLLHSLWQVTGIAILLALILRGVGTASHRYRISVLAMFAVPVLAAVTFQQQLAASRAIAPTAGESVTVIPSAEPATAVSSTAGGTVNVPADTVAPQPASSAPVTTPASAPVLASSSAGGQWQLWVVVLWLLGVAGFALRFVRDLVALRSLRASAQTLAADSRWVKRFAELRQRLQLSVPVRLLQSVRIDVPLVLGALKPVVIVPAGMLSGMTAAQIDALLLHELAHVRRHDFLVNLLQSLIETLFFFHPGVWWMSRRLREEREHCCDDLAAEACGDVGQYAGALAALEQARGDSFGMAMAADGAKPGSLLTRIRRLLGAQPACRRLSVWPVALFGTLTAIAVFASINLTATAIAGEFDIKNKDKLGTSMYAGDEQEVFAIHTDDQIIATVLITPPESWSSVSSSAGVRRNAKGSEHHSAWADMAWDKSAMKIRFDTAAPSVIAFNGKHHALDRGRVFHWNAASGKIEQSRTLGGDLPEPTAAPPIEIERVRERIIDEFSAESGPFVAGIGTWPLPEGVQLRIESHAVHGPNADSKALLVWPAKDDGQAARHARFAIAHDIMGNRQPWTAVCDPQQKVLWLASGEHIPFTESWPKDPVRATSIQRVDYSDPQRLVVHKFAGWPEAEALQPSDPVRQKLNMVVEAGQPMKSRDVTWAVRGEVQPFWRARPFWLVLNATGFRIDQAQGQAIEGSLDELPAALEQRLADIEQRGMKYATEQPDRAPVWRRKDFRMTIHAGATVSDEAVDKAIEAFAAVGAGPGENAKPVKIWGPKPRLDDGDRGVIIRLMEDGQYIVDLDGLKVQGARDELPGILADQLARAANRKNEGIVIIAHPGIEFGEVTSVLEICQKAGFTKIALQQPAPTQPEEKRVMGKDRHSLSFHRDGKPVLLLYSREHIQTGLQRKSFGEEEGNRWEIKGIINLTKKNDVQRRFEVLWTSEEPDTFYLDGKGYSLLPMPPPGGTGAGTIVLSSDADPLPVPRWLNIQTRKQLEDLGRQIDGDVYSAKYYKENRKLFAEPGAVISWDMQHPISHGDGERVVQLRVFPDGRVATVFDRKRIEGTISKEEVAVLLEKLHEEVFDGEDGEELQEGQILVIGPDNVWSSHSNILTMWRDSRFHWLTTSSGRDEPNGGNAADFEPVREKLQPILNKLIKGEL